MADTLVHDIPLSPKREAQHIAVYLQLVLQSDETVYECKKAFLDLEERMNTEFVTEPVKFHEEDIDLKFDGKVINL